VTEGSNIDLTAGATASEL